MQKKISYSYPEYLIAAIMGYKKPVVTCQMRHGINTIILAKHKYKSLTRGFHKNMTYNEPGMTVFEECPYLSATPDLIWKLITVILSKNVDQTLREVATPDNEEIDCQRTNKKYHLTRIYYQEKL